MKFILGKKIGMSEMFDEDGKITPVTLILAGPCYVLQKKTKEKEGYNALQIGFEKIEKIAKIGKSKKGKEYKFIKEARIENPEEIEEFKIGDEINVSIFNKGDLVKISGISKGKGFQGAVKRHGFSGRDATHGARHEQRTIGSTGTRFPQHVIKGKKMPGHMGCERVTIKNLKVMMVDKDKNLLVVKGAVPGKNGSFLEIKG